MKPPTVVDLVWEHDLVLSGSSGAVKMTLDSAASAGPSPMQALGFALAGCMAMDVVHILMKGRHDLRGLSTRLIAERASEEPRRFTSVALHFTVRGAIPSEPIQRAIDLSRDKYCSVWSSLRQDIELKVTYTILNAEC
jgi:putative redox protein